MPSTPMRASSHIASVTMGSDPIVSQMIYMLYMFYMDDQEKDFSRVT